MPRDAPVTMAILPVRVCGLGVVILCGFVVEGRERQDTNRYLYIDRVDAMTAFDSGDNR